MRILNFLVSKINNDTRGTLLFVLIFIILNFISAILAISQILQQSGWPANHEGTAFALRTIYYAEAIKAGDIIPLWSPEENHGLGSPMLLFYPRLFTIIASSLFLMTGLIKFSLCLTIILFSIVGAFGIFIVCRELSLNCWQSLVFSLIFPHLNYSQMDFLVRGAMAEYSAMCLLPFLLWWCLRLLNRQEFHLSIALLLILCGMAHAGIAMAGIFMLAFACIIAFIVYREKRKLIFYRTSVVIILTVILAAPYVFMLVSFKNYFNLSMYNIFLPWNWFFPWTRYFFDDIASRNFLAGLSPQLDFMFLTGILFVLTVYLIFNYSKLCNYYSPLILLQMQKHPLVRCNTFILISLFFYIWLQSPFSEWFYRYVPGMVLLQFPFRLLSFITILLVALYVCYLQFLIPKISRKIAWLLVVVPCIGTLIISLAAPPPVRGWINQNALEHPGPGNWQEYTPVAPQSIRAFHVWMEHIGKLPVMVSSKPKALVVKRATTGHFMTVYVSTGSPVEITLPAVWSKYYLVLIERNGEIYKMPSFRRGFDPRICIRIPPGENMITVKYPSLNTVLGQFLYAWLPEERDSRATAFTAD